MKSRCITTDTVLYTEYLANAQKVSIVKVYDSRELTKLSAEAYHFLT